MADGAGWTWVPPLMDLRTIADPTDRNNAINNSYHEFGLALTQYLGEPFVSNWFTYGKYASYSFGQKIRELTAGKKTLLRVLEIPLRFDAGALKRLLHDFSNLPAQGKMFEPLIKLALTQAGVPEELRAAIADGRTLQRWPALILLIDDLWRAAENLSRSMSRLQNGMVQGNETIYESVTPAAHRFLRQAAGAVIHAQESDPADPYGFLPAAFRLYAKVRRLADKLATLPEGDERQALILERERLANQANITIGFYEQLWVLQTYFDAMQDELRVVIRDGSFEDPYGTHRVLPNGGDWVNIYERMGMASDKILQPPLEVTPDHLPSLYPRQDGRLSGTIGEYFMDGLYRRRLDQPVPEILPIGMGLDPPPFAPNTVSRTA